MTEREMNLGGVANFVGQLVLQVDLFLVLLDLVLEVIPAAARPTLPANKQPYQTNIASGTTVQAYLRNKLSSEMYYTYLTVTNNRSVLYFYVHQLTNTCCS
jgi:hypothetical protein